MKIEDAYLRSKTPPLIEKLQRSAYGASFGEDPDLSFLDLLTTIAGADTQPTGRVADADETQKAEDKKAATATEKTLKARISRAGKANSASETEEPDESDTPTSVERDMALLHDMLTPVDQRYLKEAVIPALPILIGSVPIQSIFPTGRDGEISYRGFDVSPQLADLIRKGYKTGHPIRVELDERSAVVLKIQNGRVSAEFISAEKAGFFVTQRALDDLRERMAARNLPVGSLESRYRDSDSPEGRRSREEAQSEEDGKRES